MIILLIATPAWGSNTDIFDFVKQKYRYTGDAPLPPIIFLEQLALQGLYLRINKDYFEHWYEKFGKEEAIKRIRVRLQNLRAFFHIRTQIIYIGNWIPKCKTEAYIAHELTHYLQEVLGETKVGHDFGKSNFFLEIWAYNIQDFYEEEFCK